MGGGEHEEDGNGGWENEFLFHENQAPVASGVWHGGTDGNGGFDGDGGMGGRRQTSPKRNIGIM